ncbi:uncharacterized protein LOC127570977 [Pristis pectinata]|uniref:uncharacterized protein LOC127570977 n=1 Tax=Pristis pectinata TaxID=685728 RepID=UPI00223CA02F|nr:uncharacterized protein LOC127570977 [Pristis pectinata]
MGSDWRRGCQHLAVNYSKFWSPEREQAQRSSVARKAMCCPAINGVWRSPALHRCGVDQLQQIAPDCGLELDLSTNNRTSNKAETDFTKNSISAEARDKPSYRVLIQKLAELSTMGKGRELRKLYKPEQDSEQVLKKNSTNQQMEQAVVTRRRECSVEALGKEQRNVLIISDQDKLKHLPNSLQTSSPQRNFHYHSAFRSRASALNNTQGEVLPGSGCHPSDDDPIDSFHYRPINIKRDKQHFFFPLWILKPSDNKASCSHDNQPFSQQSCLDFSPEVVKADDISSSRNNEQESNQYPYPDFLPPPFNRIDFSELSLLEDHKWKEALPVRPNSPLEQLIDRIVQMEKIQFLTIQKERWRNSEMSLAAGTKTGCTRKNTKRSRKSRRSDLSCLQPPRVEVCFKKTNPAKLDKRLYRVASGHSCNDPLDFHFSNEDLKYKRYHRTNCSAYKRFKRSGSNQVILSRINSNLASSQAFAAVKSMKALAVQKSSNSTHCKYKKKQK